MNLPSRDPRSAKARRCNRRGDQLGVAATGRHDHIAAHFRGGLWARLSRHSLGSITPSCCYGTADLRNAVVADRTARRLGNVAAVPAVYVAVDWAKPSIRARWQARSADARMSCPTCCRRGDPAVAQRVPRRRGAAFGNRGSRRSGAHGASLN